MTQTLCGCCNKELENGEAVAEDLELSAIVCKTCYFDLKWAKAWLQKTKNEIRDCTNNFNNRTQ